MQVLTLYPADFENHVALLAERVERDSACVFDAIVGVRNGGAVVCDVFCKYFPDSRFGSRFDVSLSRPSSKRKEGMISKLLKKLPMGLLDMMRMAEAFLLGVADRLSRKTNLPEVEIPAELQQLLRGKENPEILIIDDAVDSGKTLQAIVETIKKINPAVKIRVAVITVTTSAPRIRADFALYRNHTLIRFPWSNDYKTSPKSKDYQK